MNAVDRAVRLSGGFGLVFSLTQVSENNRNSSMVSLLYLLPVTIHDVHTVPDIIKFTYYHCTSIDYSILCE